MGSRVVALQAFDKEPSWQWLEVWLGQHRLVLR
jgi:hypothetical protein